MFRVLEFGKLQVMVLQLLTLALGILFVEDKSLLFWGTVLIHSGLIINNVIILIPYTIAYKKNTTKNITKHSKIISIISVNVYQFNEQYGELIKLDR